MDGTPCRGWTLLDEWGLDDRSELLEHPAVAIGQSGDIRPNRPVVISGVVPLLIRKGAQERQGRLAGGAELGDQGLGRVVIALGAEDRELLRLLEGDGLAADARLQVLRELELLVSQ